jgi:hypothetical protein
MENPDDGTERHHIENPGDGTERHHVENPDDAPQKRNKEEEENRSKRIEYHKTWWKIIEILTSGEALRRMQKQCIRMRNQHVLPMNPCVRIIFESKQLVI